jgi:[1-hydroxy-2-(trimethylamino)ethyl]phosphonate dioxygenase
MGCQSPFGAQGSTPGSSPKCNASTGYSVRRYPSAFAKHSVNPARFPTQNAAYLVDQLFSERGALHYGEDVTQLEHALQCASLACRAGAKPALTIAALLHDIGHMLHNDASAAFQDGRDDHHEALGAKWLGWYFVDEVVQPVARHVQAKRYLCLREAGYWESLSAVSKQTLALQGGPMSEAEAAQFEQHVYAQDALQIRRWDDTGKQPGTEVMPLQHFLELMPHVVLPTAEGTLACP